LQPNTSQTGITPAQYYNWSGYAATGKVFTKVQGSWTVPKVTCTVASAQTVFWVGFDGFQNSTVEQAGVGAVCGGTSGKTVQYYAWWEMYPTNVIQHMPLSVSPGNSVTATVTYSSGNYAMRVVNHSKMTSYTRNATCASNLTCSRSSAEWIIERPSVSGSYTALANWGNMQLYNDTAAASTNLLPISSYTYRPINMINSNNKSLATVSQLSATGKLFTDTWNSAE
jgi:hypothetical protein